MLILIEVVVELVETTVGHGNQFLDIANLVAEPVEATTFVSLLLWSFRCFDKLSNHKLNDHVDEN